MAAGRVPESGTRPAALSFRTPPPPGMLLARPPAPVFAGGPPPPANERTCPMRPYRFLLAVLALGVGLGPAAAQKKEEVPRLVRQLKDESVEIRGKAARQLGALGPDAADA